MNAMKLSIAGLLGLGLFGFGTLTTGQENRGAISGAVLDATGAAVPGNPITATDINFGVKYSATSTSVGVYVIPGLTVGQNRVEAEMNGFEKFVEGP